MQFEKSFDFDPDFSEFNPLMVELKQLKEKAERINKKDFFVNLIRQLSKPAIVGD